MGCGPSVLTEEEKQAKLMSKQIDSQLSKEKRAVHTEVKLLLLGAGESGKSTFAKQMQIIHKNGFSEEELLTQRPVIFCNIIESTKKLAKVLIS
jgi:guanine nucleotide-binding protein G(i) subunit alpha